jgi:tRNA pseudouridine55 synthase
VTSGLLTVDKPSGITSFAVVAAVRRASGIKKVGHAGTLDPMATGVLVIALGQSTRLIRYVQEGEKEYLAAVQFGVATDSLDADGNESERVPMNFDRADLERALAGFRGRITQTPPMVSALQFEGRRLYDLARAGVEVERRPREVVISALELVDFESKKDFPIGHLRAVVSKGTYIRSLADDIAKTLGGRAHLLALRRLRVGRFTVNEAVSMDELANWKDHLRFPIEAVADLQPWYLDSFEAEAVRHGRPLSDGPGAGPWAMVEGPNRLLGVYCAEGSRAVAEVVLA